MALAALIHVPPVPMLPLLVKLPLLVTVLVEKAIALELVRKAAKADLPHRILMMMIFNVAFDFMVSPLSDHK